MGVGGREKMVVDKEVKVKWHGSVKKYYEDKGYIFTHRNAEFTVSISDLHPGSRTRINFICDKCGKEYSGFYYMYTKKENKEDLCRSCASSRPHGKRQAEICIVDGCTNPTVDHSLCNKHSLKYRKYGTPVYGIECKPSRDYECPVCHKHFVAKFSDFKKFNNNLKCPDCRRNIRKTLGQKEYVCEICGNNFTKPILIEEDGRNKFCSRECYRQYKIINKVFTGERNPNWKNGITDLCNMARFWIKDWAREALIKSKFKCQISDDSGYLEVHHVNSFNKIFNEIASKIGIINKKLSDIPKEEMPKIVKFFVEEHNKIAIPVVLTKEIHRLFHSQYGRLDNTPEQFEEFKIRYYNGEFNE